MWLIQPVQKLLLGVSMFWSFRWNWTKFLKWCSEHIVSGSSGDGQNLKKLLFYLL